VWPSTVFDVTCETYNEFWEEAEAFFVDGVAS